MISNTDETPGNTTIINSTSTDTNASQEIEFRESEQLHEPEVEMAALKSIVLTSFNLLRKLFNTLKIHTKIVKTTLSTLGFAKSKFDFSRNKT